MQLTPRLHPHRFPCAVRFRSTAKVLAECKLKYYRISECLAAWRLQLSLLLALSCRDLLLLPPQSSLLALF